MYHIRDAWRSKTCFSVRSQFFKFWMLLSYFRIKFSAAYKSACYFGAMKRLQSVVCLIPDLFICYCSKWLWIFCVYLFLLILILGLFIFVVACRLLLPFFTLIFSKHCSCFHFFKYVILNWNYLGHLSTYILISYYY